MRLKLVIVASVLAAVVGTGLAIVLVFLVTSSLEPMTRPGLFAIGIYLLPVLTTLLASVFVYRHTARRRKLQAALTAIISLLLTLSIFLVTSIVSSRPQRMQPPPETPTNRT